MKSCWFRGVNYTLSQTQTLWSQNSFLSWPVVDFIGIPVVFKSWLSKDKSFDSTVSVILRGGPIRRYPKNRIHIRKRFNMSISGQDGLVFWENNEGGRVKSSDSVPLRHSAESKMCRYIFVAVLRIKLKNKRSLIRTTSESEKSEKIHFKEQIFLSAYLKNFWVFFKKRLQNLKSWLRQTPDVSKEQK